MVSENECNVIEGYKRLNSFSVEAETFFFFFFFFFFDFVFL